MLLPTWVVAGSLFAINALFFACADDAYGVYLWLRGAFSADNLPAEEVRSSAGEWHVEASRRAFFAVTLAVGALGVLAFAAIGLSRTTLGPRCAGCLHLLLPNQDACPECGLRRQTEECSRLDAISARWPILGLLVETVGALPLLGLFIALALAFAPVPRTHAYEELQTIELPAKGIGSQFVHLVVGNSIERSWAPWLPWPGFEGHRSLRVRLIIGLDDDAAFDRAMWSTLDEPTNDPSRYWDRAMDLADATDFGLLLAVIADSPIPKEIHSDCAFAIRMELAGFLRTPWAELERQLELAQFGKTTLHKVPGTGQRWREVPWRRDSAARTLLIPGLIGLGAGLVAIWPRERRGETKAAP